MKPFSLLFLNFLLFACVTEKKVVNSQVVAPRILPGVGYVGGEPALPRNSAVTGKVLLAGSLPRPLGGIRLGLFRQQPAGWQKIHEFSSSQNGEFEVTRAIEKGQYQLRVTDPRYKGAMPLSLDEKPLQGIILEVTPAKDK